MKTSQNIFFIVKNILGNIISYHRRPTSIVLGRWRLLSCNNKINRTIDWANLDHCGPCGTKNVEK